MTEQKLIEALQGCRDCSFLSARSLYGVIARVEIDGTDLGRLTSLSEETISVISPDSQAGRELQQLFEALNRKSA